MKPLVFARDSYSQFCLYVSLFLCLSISLYLCLSALSLPNLYPYYEMLPVTSPVTIDIPSVMAMATNCIRAWVPMLRPSPASIMPGSNLLISIKCSESGKGALFGNNMYKLETNTQIIVFRCQQLKNDLII
jgi:hypothetical protein